MLERTAVLLQIFRANRRSGCAKLIRCFMQTPLKLLFVGAVNNEFSLLRTYLENAGFELRFTAAPSIEEFTAAVVSDEWDCVLSFDGATRFDALDAFGVLRQTSSSVPLVVVSSDGHEFVAVKAIFPDHKGYASDNEVHPLSLSLQNIRNQRVPSRPVPRAELSRQVLREISQTDAAASGFAEFLQSVHASIRRIVDTANCSVLLRDPLTGRTDLEYWVDEAEVKPGAKSPLRGLADHVLLTGKPLLVNKESRTSIDGSTEIMRSAKPWSSWVGVPLRASSRTFGVLALHDYDENSSFDERDLEFLSLAADQVAISIEKARSERALRESEERYRMLFDHAPDGIMISGPTERILDINSSLCRMLDYSRSELFALAPPEIVAPEEIPQIERALGDISVNSEHHREWKLRRKDGSIISADVSATRMPDNNVLAIVRDVSERKRAERAVMESEQRYRDLVENAIDIIYAHDLSGNYTSINKAAEGITGYSRSEILGMNMEQVIAPEFVEAAKEMMAAKLAGKDVTAYELEIIAKDGRRIALEVNTRLVYAKDGSPAAVQGIARDITERKLLEEKYRQSQKMEAIGLLAGGISHDFNNLLTAIVGYSEITLARMSSDDPLRPNVEEIKETGERASALTHQLLAFSRKQVLRPVVHSLNSVVLNMEKMLRRIIREDIEFHFELETDLGNIEADPGQLEQVIVNLAINAQDAMPKGGRLTIKTENVDFAQMAEGGEQRSDKRPFVRMTIADTGDGIDKKIEGRIFEPFFTTKEAGKGSGLGLSTVHGIVRQSGGEIAVRSSTRTGTTFEIYLPVVDQASESPLWPSAEDEDLTGSETVLLVEDDASVRRLVRDVLAYKGYDVLEASSGEAALEICGKHSGPIDLLLTDLVMPKMSGLELTDKFFRVRPEAKRLVMTGYAGSLPPGHLTTHFEADYLEKPFTPDHLARKVREILD